MFWNALLAYVPLLPIEFVPTLVLLVFAVLLRYAGGFKCSFTS